MPSQRVNTSGYFEVSRVKRTVAPAPMWRLTLLFSRIAPVTNSPAGTITLPPFAAWHAAIAFSNAIVQSVLLSPMAPNLVTSKSRFGNTGGLIRARMAGSCDQASCPAAGAVIAEINLALANAPDHMTSPVAPAPLRNSRRRIVTFLSGRVMFLSNPLLNQFGVPAIRTGKKYSCSIFFGFGRAQLP